MKLRLTNESKLMFEKAEEDPFYSINRKNGMSVDSFLSLLEELDDFIQDFENAISMNGSRNRIGERLHEAVNSQRTTVKAHLKNSYFSMFDLNRDTAYILMENYEMAKARVRTRIMIIRSKYYLYNLTVPRFMITRPVHEDAHSHIHKTKYSNLFSELVDKTNRKIEEKKPSKSKSKRRKIKKISLEFTAPLYLKEKEEKFARKIQRFALNAFLMKNYKDNPERYELLGVPLFLPPNLEVVEEIRRNTRRGVELRSGYLSVYRKILKEYVSSLNKTMGEIYEEASVYLHSRTEYLANLVKSCLEGNYSGLRAGEIELVWRPDTGFMKHF